MPDYIKATVSDISSESIETKLELASDIFTQPTILSALAEDERPDVRNKVAQNSSTPPEALDKLASDNIYSRYHVAQNHNTSVETLRKLSTDSDWGVRAEVAENPNTPMDVLEILGQDEVHQVRVAARVPYEVEVIFNGYMGASETIRVAARVGITEDELHGVINEYYYGDLIDLLEVADVEDIGDDDWEVTINFNGYVGCDNTYTVFAEDSESAIDHALFDAILDFSIVDFECLGR